MYRSFCETLVGLFHILKSIVKKYKCPFLYIQSIHILFCEAQDYTTYKGAMVQILWQYDNDEYKKIYLSIERQLWNVLMAFQFNYIILLLIVAPLF